MEKQDVVRRWAEQAGQYHPANPFTPTTPAMQAMALREMEGSGYRSDREYRDRKKSSDKKHHRSRSTGGSTTPPHHSRSNSYAYGPVPSPTSAAYQAPVIPPILPGVSLENFPSSANFLMVF